MLGEDNNRADEDWLSRCYRSRAQPVHQSALVRIKVWRSDGTVIFSDATQLIGQRLPMDDELVDAFRHSTVENDVTIPEHTVSKRHCLFELDQGTVAIRDCCSTNGTLLDGARLAREAPVPLCRGDTLPIGRFTFVFESPSPPALLAEKPVPLTMTSGRYTWNDAAAVSPFGLLSMSGTGALAETAGPFVPGWMPTALRNPRRPTSSSTAAEVRP